MIKENISTDDTLFKVQYNSYRSETSEVDPDDEWSRASTSTDYSINGISLVEEKDKSFDCSGAFVPFVDSNLETVYLVTVVYSTGDSFGNDKGYGIEFIKVFKTEEKAERCKKQIQANADLHNELSNSYRQNLNKIQVLMKEVHKCPTPKKDGNISIDKLYDVYYQNERNETKKFHCPWNGYFESLDYIQVDSFDISLKNKSKYKI